jgi:hypothetical protein
MRRIGIISKVGFANLELRQIDNDKYEFAKWWKGADGKEKSSKGFIISATAYEKLKKNIDKEDVVLETNENGEELKWSYMDRLNNGFMKYELRYWKDGNDLNNGLTFLPVEKEKLKEILANPLDEEIEVEQPKAEEKPKPEEQPLEEEQPKTEEQPIEEKEFNVIDVLVTVPESDINFKIALGRATMTQVNLAIIRLKARKGNHKTKLKILNDKLKGKSNSETKSKTVSKPKSVAAKPKDVKKLDESKRIELEPYQATGNHTYEECKKKLTTDYEDEDSKYCIEKLKEKCKEDGDFRNNVMQEDKSFDGAFEYMAKCAKNGYCYKRGNASYIPRELGFKLMVDYFNGKEKKKNDK